jgi:hypothetical protein
MKKILLAAFMMAGLAITANAQKGSILLFGNVGASTTNNNGGGSFNINPGIGYQFCDNWTAGVEGGYSYTDRGSITKMYTAGAFLRYTKPLVGIFSYYAQLDAVYQGQKVLSGSNSFNFNGFDAKITPAISMNVKNGFALNFGIGGLEFNTSKGNFTGAQSSGTFSFTVGQQFNIGISKNFGSMPMRKK